MNRGASGPLPGVNLWLVNIADGLTDDDYRLWRLFLPRERRERLTRFRFRADAERTLAAEILARYAVASTLGTDLATLRFVWSENGKPEVAGGEVCFSVSHSASLVACAVADAPVGVDVEAVSPLPPEVLARFVSPGEARMLGEFGADSEWPTLLWVLKESLLKALGTGIDDALGELDFSPSLCLRRQNGWRFNSYGHGFAAFFHGRYAVAACRRLDCAGET